MAITIHQSLRAGAALDASLTDLVTYVVPGRRLPTMVPAFDPSVFTYHVNITFDDTVRRCRLNR